MKNDGTEAQDIFVARMGAQPQTHVWRARDKKDLMGINRGRKVAAFPLPADFTVAKQGVLFFAEVKSCSGERFPYAQIEPGQRSAASISAACGSPYWFFIFNMNTRQWYQLSARAIRSRH